MSRRFVNLIVERCIGRYPVSTLHRINPWRCFHPTTQQALAAAEDNNSVEDARLPRAAISFYEPLQPDNHTGHVHCHSLGGGGIISMYPDGDTLLYDGASRGLHVLPAPHAPKDASVSLAVGDGLYILEESPGTEEEHPFEALVHRGPSDATSSDEKWFWRSLPPPPYVYDDYECQKAGNRGGDTYAIAAYAAVGGSQIWISTKRGGTFAFDTASGQWREAGDWALPFHGRVEYAPELGVWLGFTSEDGKQLAACDDLGAAGPPALREAWDEAELAPPLPPRWVPLTGFLVPLGGGKFCVARMFDLDVDTFVVLTGVEVVRGSRGALRMIRHKSRRYSFGCGMAQLL